MNTLSTTSPAPAGAAACPDACPAGTLSALAMLFSDLERDAEALRELLAAVAEPTALHEVLADALTLLAWRCDFGRKLAGDTGTSASTEERLVRPLVLARAGGAA